MTNKISKEEVIVYMNGLASQRESYLRKNYYYHEQLLNFFKFNIPVKSKVLEIGCGIGNLLAGLAPGYGVGIDISSEMVKIAKKKHPNLVFYQADAENNSLMGKFNYVIISDTLGYFEDIQKALAGLKKNIVPQTRIILTYHNFVWQPLLDLAGYFGLKMPQKRLNWLNLNDVANLLNLEGYEIVKHGKKILFPKKLPLLSGFFNKYLANLPYINNFCLVEFIIARPVIKEKKDFTVSVIVPAKNEFGNIEQLVKQLPKLGKSTEVIFVEGHSTDKTLAEIKRVIKKYPHLDLKGVIQSGTGKGDAVRKGFKMAKGDILMILDADLSVKPADLLKFYNAIASGKGEFINGSRLVYPLENESMGNLNMLFNKLFSIGFSGLLDQPIKDTLCGTKVLSRENYLRIAKNRSYFGNFDPFGDFDLLFGAAKANLKIVEVPIRYYRRQYGSTNISRFSHGWLLLKMAIFALTKIKFI